MYEIFSVLTGVGLVLMACVPGLSVKDRVVAALGGVFSVAYGVYVSQQTTGIYYFSVAIFVVPFVVFPYLGYRVVTSRSARVDPVDTDATPDAPPPAVVPRVGTTPAPVRPVPPERDGAEEGRAIARAAFGPRVFAATTLAVPASSPDPASDAGSDDGLTEGQRIARRVFGQRSTTS